MILAYVRCSTIEQASDGRSTLVDQERVIRGIAMMRGEASPVVYKDPGVSGATPLDERPAGKQMLEEARSGDIIVASKLDRIFRSSIDALTTVERLKALGIGVILADISTEPVSENGTGGLFFKILAAVADFERERIAERVTLGKESKKKRGGHLGGDVPYGFDKTGTGANAILKENVYEQDVIAEMAKLFVEKQSHHRVAIALNQKGMIAREGLWHAKQVCRILVRTGASLPPRPRATHVS